MCPKNESRVYVSHSKKGTVPWNKGLTQGTDERVAAIVKARKKTVAGKPGTFLGRSHTVEARQKISAYMKASHATGRAHNIGKSRWNNQPSWPEKWFMQVIDNEFKDKDYKREYPFHRFSLDFVWLHKKRVIEIDGEQHDRFPEQKARDIEKDRLLVEEGYAILRIRWKDICKDSKGSIQELKEFIEK